VRDRRPGEVVVDGRRLVADLVRWSLPIRELYVEAEVGADPKLVAAADHAFAVEARVLSGISPTRHPQGVLAVVDEPRWPEWSAERGTALYLEGLQDPGNLGAIVRAAAALGAARVLLSPGCVDPFHPVVVRGSAGAVLRVPVDREVDLNDAIERARSAGGEVWATGAGGTPTHRWRPSEPVLLLLGSEGAGLSEAAAGLADGAVAIPLERGVESLNVAVATGILLHHLRSLR
jgi:TrmH family RNA methyltransferase